MVRRAFVGYSTPIGYDYFNPAVPSASERPGSDSPNPVLDAPFGLMLLFDEIVFACRSLCPLNMRALPYVRFLGEEGSAPDLSDLTYHTVSEGGRILEERARLRIPNDRFIEYPQCVQAAGVHWHGIDNHSREISVGGYAAMGNQTFDKAFVDSVILERLGDPHLELVGNSYLQQFVDLGIEALTQAKLSELLVIDGVHSYQTVSGPYHPLIDEAREDPYLKSFRKWMSEKRTSADPRALTDVKKEVEATLRRIQDEVFMKWLDPKGHAINVGKSLVVEGIGLLLPGVGAIASALEEGIQYKKTRELRWQGFIVSMRAKREVLK